MSTQSKAKWQQVGKEGHAYATTYAKAPFIFWADVFDHFSRERYRRESLKIMDSRYYLALSSPSRQAFYLCFRSVWCSFPA